MTQCTKPDALSQQVAGDHYTKLKIHPMEFSMANNWDACAHTILKYVTRHTDKNGRQDLEKALHCVELREALWHQRHRSMDVISMDAYVRANKLPVIETAVLHALDAWVWNHSARTRLELVTVLEHLIHQRYDRTDKDIPQNSLAYSTKG